MYICGNCDKPTTTKMKMQRHVMQTRSVEYPARSYKQKGETVTDPGGAGFETVTEIPVCERCALKLKIGPKLDG